MNGKSFLFLVFFCGLCGQVSSGEYNRLLERSAQQKNKAAEQLSAFTQKQLEDRTELARKIQSAYARLTKSESELKSAKQKLAELKKNRDEFRRDESSYKFKYSVLREELISAGWKTFPEKPTAQFITAEVSKSLQKEFNILDEGRNVSSHKSSVVLRDGNTAGVPVLRLGNVAAYACGNETGRSGILVEIPGGAERVAGSVMPAMLRSELELAGENENTLIPVDVTGNLSTREMALDKSAGKWLSSGGIFIYPILFCGLLGVILIIERAIYLSRTSPTSADFTAFKSALEKGEEPAGAPERYKSIPEWRVTLNALKNKNEPPQEQESKMESTLLEEVPALNRSLSILSALAGVAPLLGLLGTVSGMIHTFSDIASFGTGNSRILSGGISEALITTQLGLMVAVPLLLCHAWLNRSVERREVMLEQWGMDALHRIAQEDKPDV